MIGVLIAEDEIIERMALKKLLQKQFGEQCRIYEAENGREAVACFEQQDIGIVIMDIGMPGMNGLQAAEEIRRQSASCTLIFLTAYDKFEYARRAISIRAREYLLKPYANAEIIDVVETAIHEQEQFKQRMGEYAAYGAQNGGQNADAASSGIGAANNHAETWSDNALKSRAEAERDVVPGKYTASEPASGQQDLNKTDVITEVILRYIREHYREDIAMHDIAAAVNYSEPYFCRIFKQQFGTNFTSYLAEYRIGEAKELLKRADINIKEVGARVGYADNNYFTKVFRRMTGVNPSDYRLAAIQEENSGS